MLGGWRAGSNTSPPQKRHVLPTIVTSEAARMGKRLDKSRLVEVRKVLRHGVLKLGHRTSTSIHSGVSENITTDGAASGCSL